MKNVRRFAGVAVTCLVLTPLLAGPASADSPETFKGSATGTALQLGVLGQSLTFGSSAAKVSSTLTAVADGAGQALVPQTVTHSEISGDNSQAATPQTCATPALP